jgi:FKBP-type peptidyl-prolyl cis-trans isomerase
MKKLSILFALPVLLSACGTPAATDPITTDTTMTDTTPAEQLLIEDEVVGTGDEAKAGDTVEVNYVGTFTDGTKFDSSYDRNQTFEFTLGAGMVIQGWDEGVAGMKVGGKRTLTIPSDMAYGPNDYGPIPGGSTLIFEVELISVK